MNYTFRMVNYPRTEHVPENRIRCALMNIEQEVEECGSTMENSSNIVCTIKIDFRRLYRNRVWNTQYLNIAVVQAFGL